MAGAELVRGDDCSDGASLVFVRATFVRVRTGLAVDCLFCVLVGFGFGFVVVDPSGAAAWSCLASRASWR